MDKRLCILGECMLEVGAGNLGESKVTAGLSYGGDTLNTAVYYARLGGSVDYLTALGDDPLSDWMLDCWRAENVGCDFVAQRPGATPGLYLIQLDERGERSFMYWRDQSAARQLLQDAQQITELLNNAAQEAQLLYLSGITLALMSAAAHQALFEFAASFRAKGGLIAFDSNHRPALWRDATTAATVYEQMYGNCDIALATADDEYALFGGASALDIVERLSAWGIPDIVVKDGANGCTQRFDGVTKAIPAQSVVVIDTTAAGDSFNAAYLRHRGLGQDPSACVLAGHKLAGAVVGQKGAIIPIDAMRTDDFVAS